MLYEGGVRVPLIVRYPPLTPAGNVAVQPAESVLPKITESVTRIVYVVVLRVTVLMRPSVVVVPSTDRVVVTIRDPGNVTAEGSERVIDPEPLVTVVWRDVPVIVASVGSEEVLPMGI